VYGVLEGNVAAHNSVRIFDGGRIYGDVSCGSFVVDEGAAFSGQCNMLNDDISPRRLSRNDRNEIDAFQVPLAN